jgi:hypothetical protein
MRLFNKQGGFYAIIIIFIVFSECDTSSITVTHHANNCTELNNLLLLIALQYKILWLFCYGFWMCSYMPVKYFSHEGISITAKL